MKTIKVKYIAEPGVTPPKYQTPGSAGCDVHAAASVIIAPGQRMLVPTGLRLEIPEGFECQVRPRSGLALRYGVIVFNTPSTIDSDYRGEVSILLINAGNMPFYVGVGDRIAQFVFAPVTVATFEEVDELSSTTRGEGGWGHSGRT